MIFGRKKNRIINIELKKKQLFWTIIDIWDKKKHHFMDKFLVAKSAALTNFFNKKKWMHFLYVSWCFAHWLMKIYRKIVLPPRKTGIMRISLSCIWRKNRILIDDEPTKKQVYLTFYRKFPKKKQKKNGLFWYSKKTTTYQYNISINSTVRTNQPTINPLIIDNPNVINKNENW